MLKVIFLYWHFHLVMCPVTFTCYAAQNLTLLLFVHFLTYLPSLSHPPIYSSFLVSGTTPSKLSPWQEIRRNLENNHSHHHHSHLVNTEHNSKPSLSKTVFFFCMSNDWHSSLPLNVSSKILFLLRVKKILRFHITSPCLSHFFFYSDKASYWVLNNALGRSCNSF